MRIRQNTPASAVRLTSNGVRLGIRRLLPIALFVVPFGIAFGAAAVAHGLAPYQAIAMSASVFAGAAQFAALDMFADPLPFLSLAMVVLAINARHLILGAALSRWVNNLSGGKRLLSLSVLSDANFAEAHRAFKCGEEDVGILLGGGLVLWANWVAGTAIGALAGSSIGNLDRFGIDVVMAAYFAAAVSTEMRDRRSVPPLAIAALIAVTTADAVPAGWNIIAGALAGGLTGMLTNDR